MFAWDWINARGGVCACAMVFAAIALQPAAARPGANPDAGATVASDSYLHAQVLVPVSPSRRLNLFCLGTGKPVVLLDAGAGFDMVLWRHVQGRVARQTRVCSYDRAGFGFSDAGEGPLDANSAVEDIHRLVQSRSIAGPVVYVGHSIAGLYAMKLRSVHPEDVAGVVLVDPAFVGQFKQMTTSFSTASKATLLRAFGRHLAGLARCRDLAGKGLLAAPVGTDGAGCVDASGYPEPLDPALQRELTRQNAQLKVASAILSEYTSLLARDPSMRTINDQQIGDAPVSFGNVPFLVLSHGNTEPLMPGLSGPDTITSSNAWRAAHSRMAATSRRGEMKVIAGAGHFIQLDNPGAVASAIGNVVGQVRRGTWLPDPG